MRLMLPLALGRALLLAGALGSASSAVASEAQDLAALVPHALATGAEQILPEADATDLGFAAQPPTKMLIKMEGSSEFSIFATYKGAAASPKATHLILTTLHFLDAEKTKANGWTFMASPSGKLQKAVQVDSSGAEPTQYSVALSKSVKAAFEHERRRFIKLFIQRK